MKRIISSTLLSLLMIFSLSACGKADNTKKEYTKTTCTMDITTDTDTEKEIGIIESDGDIVKKLTQRIEFILNDVEDSTNIDKAIEILTDAAKIYDGVNGYTFKAEKTGENTFYTELLIDYEKIDLKQLTETFGEEYMNRNFPNGREVKIDEVKELYFQEYECK